ncbi:MAG: tRNA 4-thiouridine(8) synthase ThiI [Candidatus Altiarchaeota archaeon]|nr:tRNA 4-thiouridine(8) synthase ThiI [Candidatus Altiarchaeota archaeon]
MDYNCILVRYGEIALKGRNRGVFDSALASNIRHALTQRGVSFKSVARMQGRFIVESSDTRALEAISKVFGIVSYSPAIMVGGFDELKEAALKVLKAKECSSFRVTAQRLDKNVKIKSTEMNENLGAFLVGETGLKVSLKSPGVNVGVDYTKNNHFVYTESFGGLGGLPVGVSGKVVCLLSGGIDSPVAGLLLMKRGCSVVFIHFLHDESKVPRKIVELHKILSDYQPRSKLILVPSASLEMEIVKNVPSKYRILVLRRMFMRAAERIMVREKAKAIATGDNVAQVASQTLDNLSVVSESTRAMIIRPLACFDKSEIIELAKKFGTYEQSIEPYVDCCNFLLPEHPETRAKLSDVLKVEENFDERIIDAMMEKVCVIADKKE